MRTGFEEKTVGKNIDQALWPANTVELKSVSDLVPYARNSRTHSDEQVSQIMASIREWGFTIPVLVDETGGMISGHGRLMAAQRLGLEQVPCMTARGWSNAQKRAYIIADNKLALGAGWDLELLKSELSDIATDFDLSLTGFGEDMIENMLRDVVEDDETDALDILDDDDGTSADAADEGLPEFKIPMPEHVYKQLKRLANERHEGVVWHAIAEAMGGSVAKSDVF